MAPGRDTCAAVDPRHKAEDDGGTTCAAVDPQQRVEDDVRTTAMLYTDSRLPARVLRDAALRLGDLLPLFRRTVV